MSRSRRAATAKKHPSATAPTLAPQTPLLGKPGDAFEQEAHHAADRIMAGGTAAIRTNSATPPPLQAAPASATVQGAAPSAITRAAKATQTGGQPLPSQDRAFFEPRFGRSLSDVRLHTGAEAASAANGINASAFTHGNNIAFASGQYNPAEPQGRHLLAHELTHTLQQGSARTIRRTCPSDKKKIPPGGSKEFEAAVDAVHALKSYKKLNKSAKDKADHIIDGARASACPMYYITKLRALFDTKENPPAATGKKFRSKGIKAAAAEKTRLAEQAKLSAAVGSDLENLEENATANPSRNMKPRTGKQNKTYLIDDRDVTNIYVHMKVLPKPRKVHGKKKKQQAADDVARTKSLEDGIEVAVLMDGYLLNLEFADKPGKDVFEVLVNPESWPTSGNWISNATTLAHEAHHLLGLEDRYNYIESHATNKNMKIASRLHWFREQMVRSLDPLAGESKMERSSSAKGMNEQDLCALVAANPSDPEKPTNIPVFRECLVKRYAMRSASSIEGVAKGLNAPYSPRHAAMLKVMSEAWAKRPTSERTASCNPKDAGCGTPPEPVFGDPGIIARDIATFPLTDPHDQRAGTTLKRKARGAP